MKILQINKFFYLRGGAERHYFDLIALLEKNGHEVIPFAMQDERNRASKYSNYFVSNADFSGFSLQALSSAGRILYSREARKKLTQLIRDTKPDIAHVHLMYHHLSPSILLALRDAGIPVVLTIHDWQSLSPNYLLFAGGKPYNINTLHSYWRIFLGREIKHSFLMSGLAAFAGWVHHGLRWYEDLIAMYIAPSKFVHTAYLQNGWENRSITHIPHFVTGKIQSKVVQKKPYILYAGRLSAEKGIDKLVNYWIEKDIPYTLHIAGSGPLAQQLQDRVQRAGNNTIQFLGFVQPKQLEKRMQQAAAVIIPSVVYETFGLTLSESWQQRTGVIANAIGALGELVHASQGGVLFSWEKDNLEHVLAKYMAHESIWHEYGKQGARFAQEQLGEEQYYTSLMRVYKQLL